MKQLLLTLFCIFTISTYASIHPSGSLQTSAKEDKSLPVPKLEDGMATIKGQIIGFTPEMDKQIEIYVNNPILRKQDPYFVTIQDDGRFECKVPVIASAMPILFRVYELKLNTSLIVGANSELNMQIDLAAKNDDSVNQYIIFEGANSTINNLILAKDYVSFVNENSIADYDAYMKGIEGMTVNEYRDYHKNRLNNVLKNIDESNFNPALKEYAKIYFMFNTLYYFRFGDSQLESSYRQHNGIKDRRDAIPEYIDPYIDVMDYYSIIKDMPINSPMALYSSDYDGTIYSLSDLDGINTSASTLGSPDGFVNFDKIVTLSEQEKEVYNFFAGLYLSERWSKEDIKGIRERTVTALRNFKDSVELAPRYLAKINWLIQITEDENVNLRSLGKYGFDFCYMLRSVETVSEGARLGLESQILNLRPDRILDESKIEISVDSTQVRLFMEKYNNLLMENARKQSRARNLQPFVDLIGTDKGIAFDFIRVQGIASKVGDMIPLTDADFDALKDVENPFFIKYLTRKNEELKTNIKRNKENPHNIYQTQQTNADSLLYEILKPYEGKVVFIDFWNTWCGPCISAMKEFDKTKESYKDKDVVFLYIADESSPTESWNNMVASIGGEHYRITKQQMNSLKAKFGFSGIPSYAIYNKKGENIYFRTGFEGAKKLSEIIDKELEK